MRTIVVSLLGVLVLLFGGKAYAVDGVIEINQAAVEAGSITTGDTPGFPATISQTGSYRLTGNLVTGLPVRDGLFVTASDVTVDLNGFSITGPIVCTGDPPAPGTETPAKPYPLPARTTRIGA